MKVPAATRWLSDAGAQQVCKALDDKVYFVGGCVRDALLGLSGGDVDMSTPLKPEKVTAMAQAAGLKVVPTGLEHGTVTVVASGKGYEVTTFRRDVETDGRRAVVRFSEDMVEDARRRDFTLNALYGTPTGKVIDPLGDGLRDCLDRRIRFIEDAATRIREDYLRILRYFRFHASYAPPGSGFDPDAIDAISRNIEGLDTLSAERIGSEMLKLLRAPDPAPAVAAMRATGCLARLLPGSDDRFLGPVATLAAALDLEAEPMLRLAALGGENPCQRLRLSRADARLLHDLSEAGYGAQPLAEVAYRKGTAVAQGAAVLRAAMSQQPVERDHLDQIETGAKAVFPVRARDLMPGLTGPALGAELQRLEQLWIASGFALSREELMTRP